MIGLRCGFSEELFVCVCGTCLRAVVWVGVGLCLVGRVVVGVLISLGVVVGW